MARSISRVLACALLVLTTIASLLAAPALADDDNKSTDIVVNVKKTSVVTGSFSVTIPTSIPLAANTANRDDEDFGRVFSSSRVRIVNGGSNDAVIDRVTIGNRESRLNYASNEDAAKSPDAYDVLFVQFYDAAESTASYDEGSGTWSYGKREFGLDDTSTPRFGLDNTVGELTGFSHRWTVPRAQGGQLGYSIVGVYGWVSALSREWTGNTICTINWSFAAKTTG